MKKILALLKKYDELVKYIIIGGCTTVVSLVTKYILLFTILNPRNAFELQVAIVISWIAAVSFAYVMNRIFVFKSQNKKRLKEISMFVSSRVATLLLEAFIMWFFVTLLKLDSNNFVIIWTLLSQLLVMVGNYILSKFLVFSNNANHGN